jgi:hypothetical protein
MKPQDLIKQSLRELIVAMITQPWASFCTLIALHNIVDQPHEQKVQFGSTLADMGTPVYYASALGFDWVLDELLRRRVGNSGKAEDAVNASGGY